jgi:hypothetical protein
MPDRWTLVTDSSADEAQLQQFREHGVEVVTVEIGYPGATLPTEAGQTPA